MIYQSYGFVGINCATNFSHCCQANCREQEANNRTTRNCGRNQVRRSTGLLISGGRGFGWGIGVCYLHGGAAVDAEGGSGHVVGLGVHVVVGAVVGGGAVGQAEVLLGVHAVVVDVVVATVALPRSYPPVPQLHVTHVGRLPPQGNTALLPASNTTHSSHLFSL